MLVLGVRTVARWTTLLDTLPIGLVFGFLNFEA